MKKAIMRVTLAIMCLVLAAGAIIPASASAYSTYTYSINGNMLDSPDAYTPVMQIDAKYMDVEGELSDASDIFCDTKGNVFIADAGNNRIISLDRFYKLRFTISSFTKDDGTEDSLLTPRGLYVTDEKIFVADTDHNRIVVFDLAGKYLYELEQPRSNLFGETTVYKPIALAVDASERIYVVSSSNNQGVIVLDPKGEFQGFIGAQQVEYTAWQILWRSFQTAEQRARTQKLVSKEFNNITIDNRGFIYVTTSAIDASAQAGSIKSKSGAYAPVKKLNSGGEDILERNGFFGPGGYLDGSSVIVDVALGPEGTWSILDQNHSEIFTYDQSGNLLFAFGGKGVQVGNLQSAAGIAYQDDTLLVLDKVAKNVTIYTRTEYGDILVDAIANDNNKNYDTAVDDWFSILQRNSNFDAAYVGIGKAYYRSGRWSDAMEYFKSAYDTSNYSGAFKQARQEWANKYFIIIPITVIVLGVLITKFFSFAKKVNKRTALASGKKTFGQEILYAFHLIFHPFDGFWDLKHEKRGSVRGAIFYIACAIVTFCYQSVGRPYIFNPYGTSSSIFATILSVLVPFFLWVVANWCLTTLFDGEGSFKDIFIACGYSLIPIPLLVIPSVLLSNVVVASEAQIVNLLVTLAWVWVGMLLFFGTMVTHDYSLGKNILTCIGTIVGMAFIMFAGILFSTLLSNMIGFISGIITEASYRF